MLRIDERYLFIISFTDEDIKQKEDETISDSIGKEDYFPNKIIKSNMSSEVNRCYPCRYCDVKFKLMHHKNRHEMTVHLMDGKTENKMPFNCSFCRTKFYNIAHKNRHEARVHYDQAVDKVIKNENGIKCLYCPRTFIKSSQIKRHQAICWKVNESEEENHQAYQRPNVSEDFDDSEDPEESSQPSEISNDSDHNDKENNNIIITGRPYHCEKCSKSFTRRYDLKRHISQVHLKLKLKQSDICEPEESKQLLDISEETKSIGKRLSYLQCSLCTKTFADSLRLRRHVATHQSKSNRKLAVGSRFHCEKCNGKSYTRRFDLQRHIARAHSKQLIFPCGFCNKKFAVQIDMKQHENKIHLTN